VNLERLSAEAYQTKDSIATFSFSNHLPFLSDARKQSLRGRTRILMHPKSDSRLHEMFVLYGSDTFIRANKHIGRDESVHLLSGICDVILFSDSGTIEDVIRLDADSQKHPTFILLPANKYHSVIIRSSQALLFESTPGPFDASITVYADWSPIETDKSGQQDFFESVDKFVSAKDIVKLNSNIESNLVRESEKVFRLLGKTIIGAPTISILTEALKSESLDRVRVCIHENDKSELQEMFMVFSKDTFVTPSFHSDKDESLFVIDGLATYVFFDESGKVIKRVPLGPKNNSFNRASYCRIPLGVVHALVVESDFVVVKETTSGPFQKSLTYFPDWAPKNPSPDEVTRFNFEYIGS
jgi:cupin fold WbuC family metalloprotein